ncbi:MAG: hypothetical protein GY895_12060 [Phycisphaera sp.]|nr:hypothetical protein [Phycisphaera sp.]
MNSNAGEHDDDSTRGGEVSFESGRTWSLHGDRDTGLLVQWGKCINRWRVVHP